MYMCAAVCVYMHVNADAWRPEKGARSLELEFQVAVSLWMWVLGIQRVCRCALLTAQTSLQPPVSDFKGNNCEFAVLRDIVSK